MMAHQVGVGFLPLPGAYTMNARRGSTRNGDCAAFRARNNVAVAMFSFCG